MPKIVIDPESTFPVTAGPDLTGEGRRDLFVYRLGESESAEVLAIKGDDGRILWSKEGMIFVPQ